MDTSVESEFTEFVVRRSHALLRVAYALTGDAHAAEDLVQQALAKAFVHWRRIHGEAEPYVKRIIYHDSASRWRRRSQRAETVMAAPPDRTVVPDAATTRTCACCSEPHCSHCRRASARSSCCATSKTSPSTRPPRFLAAVPAPWRVRPPGPWPSCVT